MKLLPTAHYKDKYWRDIEKKIKRIFFDMLYRKLFKATKKQDELYNQNDVLYDAIVRGDIGYSNGSFFGKFNSRTTKEFRKIGAQFDKQTKTWKLPRKELPSNILSALVVRDTKDEQLNTEVLTIIDEAEIDKTIAESGIKNQYKKTISAMDSDIKGTLKAVGVNIVLTPGQKDMIAEEWSENLEIFIKNFADENILRLRERVTQNVASGQRAENLVKMIEQEFGVTQSKAKFLARQETSLLMSKMRETRYKDTGVARYRWATSGDTRVRERHKDLNGKIFTWDAPPIVDDNGNRAHPGEDFNCRCTPIPILDEVA